MLDRSESNIYVFERVKLTPDNDPKEDFQNEVWRKSLGKILLLRLLK